MSSPIREDLKSAVDVGAHLSQIFGVGYMNQKRITSDGAHGSTSPLIPIEQYAFVKTFSLYILSYVSLLCLTK